MKEEGCWFVVVVLFCVRCGLSLWLRRATVEVLLPLFFVVFIFYYFNELFILFWVRCKKNKCFDVGKNVK